MLCVGIARHGYGAWAQIRDDPDLALADKFFLEEHRVDRKNERLNGTVQGTKSPGAVHLVRRADYLLSVLKDKISNGTSAAAKKAVENHHRNNKKSNLQRQHASTSVSASPAPSVPRKSRESDKLRHRPHNHGHRESVERPNTPTTDAHRYSVADKARMKSSRDGNQRHRRSNDNGGTGLSAHDNMLRIVFKPTRESLKRVSQVTKENIPSKQERAGELRRLLRQIGDFIRNTLEGEEEARASLEGRLW